MPVLLFPKNYLQPNLFKMFLTWVLGLSISKWLRDVISERAALFLPIYTEVCLRKNKNVLV